MTFQLESYHGINYGMPENNRDPETLIRYGIISQHCLSPFALEDFEPDYGPATCPDCGDNLEDTSDTDFHAKFIQDAKKNLDDGLTKGQRAYRMRKARKELDELMAEYYCLGCHKGVEADHAWGDEPVGGHVLDDGEYKAHIDSSGDVWVLKSPYFTFAQYCSPCAPGACHLENPVDPSGPKCYCFGPEFFEHNEAPYPIWSVETGNRRFLWSVYSEMVNTGTSDRSAVVQECDTEKEARKEFDDTLNRLVRQEGSFWVKLIYDVNEIKEEKFVTGTPTTHSGESDGGSQEVETPVQGGEQVTVPQPLQASPETPVPEVGHPPCEKEVT